VRFWDFDDTDVLLLANALAIAPDLVDHAVGELPIVKSREQLVAMPHLESHAPVYGAGSLRTRSSSSCATGKS